MKAKSGQTLYIIYIKSIYGPDLSRNFNIQSQIKLQENDKKTELFQSLAE